jgi:GT2 family glycosyltransferase/glycosyltransferase involved in cell wall biosynthesis
MPLCSIIIPVHNKAPLTAQCLDVLLKRPSERVGFEVIVVDDGSTDETRPLLGSYGDRLRVVEHQTNTGFATACNDGAVPATGDWLLFLNNDIIPQPGWLDALHAYTERHPRAAIVGSKLLFPNDTIQHAGIVICQDRFPRHIYTGFPAHHPAVNKSRRYQLVTGGCMLVRRALFAEFGGFDTSFLNSFEDNDLCLRLGERGHEVHYCHESVLYHLESATREGRTAEEERSGQLYLRRWGHRVRPDDLDYFVEDGLLSVEHLPSFPINFSIAPLLGIVKGTDQEGPADRILEARTKQVHNLLKENIRLNVRLTEAAFRAANHPMNGAIPAEAAAPQSIVPPEWEVFREDVLAPARPAPPQIRPVPPSSSATALPFGINVAGLFASEKGVGEGARTTLRSLEAAGIPYVLNNFTDDGSLNRDTAYNRYTDHNPHRVNLLHIGADIFPEFVLLNGGDYFRDRYNIAYWAWELSRFPPEWESSLQYLDEIWVPSNFTLDAISRVAPIPVVRIPHSLPEKLPTVGGDRAQFGLPPEAYLFLFIFDYASHLERKNPLGLIKAFRRAFSRRDNAFLILKSCHSEANPDMRRAVTEAAEGANIQIIDRVLSREEVNTLLHLADCFVSLHRSEGFGLPMAEAMTLEKPVVATGYSGNTDFMNQANSFLVKYRLTEIKEDHGPYKKGCVWADPDLDHAAEFLRLVYVHQEFAREVGRRARKDMLHGFHPQLVGRLIRDRLRRLAVPRHGARFLAGASGSGGTHLNK